jgi:hypothetical protein
MKSLPELTNFTFVPMLTETDEAKKKSTKKDLDKALREGKPGSQNRELLAYMEHLQEIEDDLEYFTAIRAYFKKENIPIDIFDRERFTHEKRDNYFQALFKIFPKKSLIFLDPAIGLEERRPTKKHLLMAEVKKIYDQMDTASVMMIYQHFPRMTPAGYVEHRSTHLADLTGSIPVTITDNEIIFFMLAKNPKIRAHIELILNQYANTYSILKISAYGN